MTVPPARAGDRLDRMLASELPQLSRTRIKSLILDGRAERLAAAGHAAANITDPALAVKPGETYLITVPEILEGAPLAEDIPLNVVFEDEHLIVIDKPAGLVVHPAAGNYQGTLVNALLFHCGDSLSGIGGIRRPGIVHRLDKDTSGLMVSAKSDAAHRGLSEQFQARSVERSYLAIVKGLPRPAAGRIEGAIGRHPRARKKMTVVKTGGKAAATRYRVLKSFAGHGAPLASLVRCRLETGRTHQVRVHMAHIGHPLLGDTVYGRRTALGKVPPAVHEALQELDRQALHAAELGFLHPVSQKPFKFSSPYPDDMGRLLAALEETMGD